MRKHMSGESPPGGARDPCNQPVGIALDVEDRISPHSISRWEDQANVDNRSPLRPFGYAIPDVEGSRQIGMPYNRLEQLLSADYVHFLDCSQCANKSRTNPGIREAASSCTGGAN